jgi:Ca-activated chloride channel family protein
MHHSRSIGFGVFFLCLGGTGMATENPNPLPRPSQVLKELKYSGQAHVLPHKETNDHSLAPYLYVADGDPQRDRVPLKKTWAEVRIAGVIAGVKVHQIFENIASKPIEAIYVFPGSTRAAVHAMRMTIGNRTIEAKIKRRALARAEYESAKQAGQRTSLLEQERSNVFTTRVANIMPGDRIEVALDYSELIVPENATYEFVYPTVVGPRYAGGANPQSDQWMANPHLSAGEKAPYDWDLQVQIQTSIPIKELTSPSHKITVNYTGASHAHIRLDTNTGANKDFVLRYRLAGEKIESGLLVYEEPSEGLNRPTEKFFALLVQPPIRPKPVDIPSREFIFLLDVSGSMHGFPLETTKTLMRKLLPQLRASEHFNVVLFSGANRVWSPSGSKRATTENIEAALHLIDRQTGGGGTELLGGLAAAYGIPSFDKGIARTIVVVTDGYVGVENQTFRLIRERLHEANLFAFGIGSSVNRGLIEGMARAGLGEPFIVLGRNQAQEESEKLRKMIDRPVLTDIRIALADAGAYDIAPANVPDLLAERPLIIFGKFRTHSHIEITGRTGRGTFHQSIDLNRADARSENQPIRSLWARKWVEILEDEFHMGADKSAEEAITSLGLTYSLLTSFTSFLAIDSEIANRTGQVETIRQPLPMPEGVSNYAIAYPPSLGSAMNRAKIPLEGQNIQGPTHCLPTIVVVKATNPIDTRDLLRLLHRLTKMEGCFKGQVKLQITLDSSGRIRSVQYLEGNKLVGESLVNKLTNQTTTTKAVGPDLDTLLLTIKNR